VLCRQSVVVLMDSFRHLCCRMSKNVFSISRELLEHDIWLSEKFTKGQAWIDLIGHARWRAGYCKIGIKRIEVGRGQLVWSILQLSKRWMWSYNKVKRFLNELQTDEQIDYHNLSVTTLISITNYDDYQFNERSGESIPESPDESSGERPDERPHERQKNKGNKGNKEKKGKKSSSDSAKLPPSKRIKWDDAFGFIGINSKDMDVLSETYPACNIEAELKKMHAWLLSNPAKAKKKNFFRFITNWMSRHQERGGGRQSNPISEDASPVDKILLLKYHEPLMRVLKRIDLSGCYNDYCQDKTLIPGHIKSQMEEEAEQ